MNAWSQLPNAELIDHVIESLKNKPEAWAAAWNETMAKVGSDTLTMTGAVARDLLRDAGRHATWDAGRHATWDAVNGTTWESVWPSASTTACCTLLALVAYDDCDQYLSMTYEELYVWSKISESTQAILLLPLKWVQEHEQQSLVTTA